MVCNMGDDPWQILHQLCHGEYGDMASVNVASRAVPVGCVTLPLPAIHEEKWKTRTNALLLLCLQKLKKIRESIPGKRIGVVLGSSNSGMEEYHQAYQNQQISDTAMAQLEVGNVAGFIAQAIGAQGPCYTVSTACSSSAKAMISAARLLEAGICDVVITGGGDALCSFALHGFDALHLISETRSKALTIQGGGVNHGEGAALFVLTRKKAQVGNIILSGYGETSDAYHLTTPDPSGKQAASAMQMALDKAGITAKDIDYVNLHGTGTDANDKMELEAMRLVFGTNQPPCGSTKPYTGHALGAAGAIEAVICATLLQADSVQLPQQPWLVDSKLNRDINFAHQSKNIPRHILSNSFAFGGNNVSIILSRHA